jgi:DNA polymerase IV
MHTIFHLDLDAFFVSVERIIDPSLNNKPVVVGGDPHGRGVVAACSYEAREYGLHSAMPIRQAYRLCPHGMYIHGHFGEYEKYSHGVKSILEKMAPIIEQASVDEFYMDFSGCEKIYGSFQSLASHIQKEVWIQLGLPSSIGIGSNKLIAKIASDFYKPKGITFVLHGMEREFLAPMPVGAIPGVGKVTLKELNAKGIHTIGELASLSQDYLSAAYGKNGLDLWRRANGIGTDYLTVGHERKSISKETTFDNDVVNRKFLIDTVFNLTGKVCHYLREENWQASTISIKLRYSDFVTVTRAETTKPTNDDKIIFETASRLMNKAITRRIAVRLIGLHLSNLTKYSRQEILFDDENTKRTDMINAINHLRAKYGYSSIQIGNAGEKDL